MSADAAATSYDEVPYPSFPIPQAHPDHLAALATLFGLDAPPVESCRVLELGCADAGNLIAMAEQLPGSAFVGLDLSARHIETARATAAAVGLKNITLRQLSVLDVPADFGPFDYILAHGLYSWVPPAVQDRMLGLCGQTLSPRGVAYVSYNTYPGWHARGTVREMMRYHARGAAGAAAATAAARDLLVFLLEAVPEGAAAYRGLLEEEQGRLERVRDTYIYHEHLEDANEPVYFSTFVERAGSHGLRFMTEADLGAALAPRLPPATAAALARLADGALTREQYLDFLTNRMFRQTLLCRADVALADDPQSERLAGLHVTAQLEFDATDAASTLPQQFRGPSGLAFTTGHRITKAALACLAEAWPRSVPFAQLQARARARLVGDAVVAQEPAEYDRDTRQLAENLLQGFATGVVDLHAHAAPVVGTAGERPRAPAFTRRQAGEGIWVTSGWHQLVNLDPLTCRLLQHLDGTRDRAGLLDVLVRAVTEDNIALERYGRAVTDVDRVRGILRRELDANLARLCKCALLVA